MQERLTARTVLINDENKILLVQFNSLEDGPCWILPGGKIEESETPRVAAQRELFEETGVASAQFLEHHSWYCEAIIPLHGTPTLFKEHIFLAYTTNSQVNLNNLNEDEKDIICHLVWWDIKEFRDQKQLLLPRGLLNELDLIVYHHHKPQNTIIVAR